jgi:hypothetical protein
MNKKLDWLFGLTALILFSSTEGRTFFPSIFSKPYIPWLLTGLTAVLLSIGLFLSAYSLFSGKSERMIGWTCLGFVTLFSIILESYIVITPMMIHLSDASSSLSTSNPELLKKLLTQLYSGETNTEGKRQNLSKVIYVFYGVMIPYLRDDGSYISYQPTEKDREDWNKTQTTAAQLANTKEMISWQLKQLPYIASAYIGFFLLTFWMGILWVMHRRTGS